VIVDLDTPEHALCSETIGRECAAKLEWRARALAAEATVLRLRQQLTDTMCRNEKLGQELQTQARGHARTQKRLNGLLQHERSRGRPCSTSATTMKGEDQ
jgi:hypothetical protein